ncbi:uncharacterized protein [Leptinotarsa decemlineata]|uniref:uncharacterized protein n=1 Tax=Leptinotarsa decemlineata TaxID=7539 RepID=UPI003D307849
MNTEKEKLVTVQGFGSPVPVLSEGGKQAPPDRHPVTAALPWWNSGPRRVLILLETPPRTRTLSLPDENSCKRKREESIPEEKKETDNLIRTLKEITCQVKLLEKVIKNMYKPKSEICEISSRLSLQIEKLQPESFDNWQGRSSDEISVPQKYDSLVAENEGLREQIHLMKMKHVEELDNLLSATNSRCDNCTKTYKNLRRRGLLKKEETFRSFSTVTEAEWQEELLGNPKTERKPIWNAPKDTGIILTYDKNINSNDKVISRAIKSFGGKDGLIGQNKTEGEVAMMCHSLGFPDKDGNVNATMKWIYYPIIGEQISSSDKSDELLFQSLTRIKNHALTHNIQNPAIPKIENVLGVVVLRMLLFLLDGTNIQLSVYKPNFVEENTSQTKRPRIRSIRDQKNRKPKQDALLIQMKETLYADLLKTIKAAVNPDEIGADIKEIRKTRNNEVILTVQNGRNKAEDLKKALMEKIPDATTLLLSNKKTVHIKGMDATITENDVSETISKIISKEADTFEVRALRPAYGNRQNATLVMSANDADKLIELKSVKIGWTMCRLAERQKQIRCSRCWEHGHFKDQCSGPDRRNFCLRCAEEGHRAVECHNGPYCIYCRIEGHQSGTTKCREYRRINEAELLLVLKVDLVVLSEPNTRAICGRKDWVYGNDLKTAIKVINNNTAIKSQGYGHGFTYIVTTKAMIISCYSSGNDNIERLEKTLQELEQRIRTSRTEVIITGDFNAKSPEWGMNFSDARGHKMTEWIAANNLIVVNHGEKPTFVHQSYGSILDLTISTENIRPLITQWNVLDDESLSDHRYIIFEVRNDRSVAGKHRSYKGWQVKRLDQEKLKEIASELDENQGPVTPEEFSMKLKEICNAVMPRKRGSTTRKPVYWWNDEIAELRKQCLKKRREHTRNAKNAPLIENERLWEAYKKTKKRLRFAIKKAKKDCWKRLCEDVDYDIWGNGYKIVMKGMLGFETKPSLTLADMKEVVKHLFPIHEEVSFALDRTDNLENFTTEEVETTSEKLKNNNAPGPSEIPQKIMKVLASEKPSYIVSVYNKLAKDGIFPPKWKKLRLMLLRKGDKNIENPSSYGPICLLDSEGKFYEYLLLNRLNEEITRTGGLSEQQFGFRKGRQTVDAVNVVLRIANDASVNGNICATITLDVKNAFNSASWQLILETLRSRGIKESLIVIIASYLSEREIILETTEDRKLVRINSGVPQRSVLGPTLWNLLYDELFTIETPDGVNLVGFADDVALVVTAKKEKLLMNQANRALLRVSRWMKSKRLQLALQKTEAVLLTRKRKLKTIKFDVEGIIISPSKSIKYLGVWIDTKLTFTDHVNKSILKAEKTVNALSNLMPNVGGPKASKRRLLSSVVHSQILYGAPCW